MRLLEAEINNGLRSFRLYKASETIVDNIISNSVSMAEQIITKCGDDPDSEIGRDSSLGNWGIRDDEEPYKEERYIKADKKADYEKTHDENTHDKTK